MPLSSFVPPSTCVVFPRSFPSSCAQQHVALWLRRTTACCLLQQGDQAHISYQISRMSGYEPKVQSIVDGWVVKQLTKNSEGVEEARHVGWLNTGNATANCHTCGAHILLCRKAIYDSDLNRALVRGGAWSWTWSWTWSWSCISSLG